MGLSDQWWWQRVSPETRQRLIDLSGPLVRRRRPRWGNLRRKRPFSESYGYDRGQPIDRLYIERFLQCHAHTIGGDVLEVKGSTYTTRFGTGVTRSDIIDIDPGNTAATITGDLCDPDILAPESFDCVILTQTLQFISSPVLALENVWRSLRPGGTLLLAAPCLGRIDPDLPQADCWRWTAAGLRTLLTAACPAGRIEVEARGNLVAAISVLIGLAVDDLRSGDLAEDHEAFPVVACAKASKGPEFN
jgi:SAM-dependent methyltransferase